jgi:hypothetical protein
MMNWSLGALRVTGLLCTLLILQGTYAPLHVHAAGIPAPDHIRIRSQFENRPCGAELEESGAHYAFMVTARLYALCHGLGYRWDPTNQTFKFFKHIELSLTFALNSPIVTAREWGRLVVYDLSQIDAVPYERRTDGANMAPLRFTNDFFNMRTEWDAFHRQVDVWPYARAISPWWDRKSLDYHMDLVNADGTVGEPELGWTLYPSTVRLFQEAGPMLAKYKEARKRHQIHIDWVNLMVHAKLREYDIEMEFPLGKEENVREITFWFTDPDEVELLVLRTMTRLMADLEREGTFGGVALSLGGAIGTMLVVTNWPAALSGVVWGAGFYLSANDLQQEIYELEDCIGEAKRQKRRTNKPFRIGVRISGLWNIHCLNP